MTEITHEDLAKIQATVRALALGQALGGFGLGSTISVGAIMATELSGGAARSGAAATPSTLSSALAVIPLANLAARRGRDGSRRESRSRDFVIESEICDPRGI